MNRNNKKKKISKGNLFIFFSIVFILLCIIYFGGRLIYFYKQENPKQIIYDNLRKGFLLEKNIVKTGEGLYKENKDLYVYKGKDVNNYVKFEGIIYRVIDIENGNIKMITDDNQTSLVYGINVDYEKSYIRSWLNSYDDRIKGYLETIENRSLLLDTKSCKDKINEKKISCNDYITDKVGLLSVHDYNRAGGKNSYLNIGKYFWTSNVNEKNIPWYIYSKGSLNNTVYQGTTYYSYGVRPVITIDGSVKIISGTGEKENPFIITKETDNNLSNKYIGDYVEFNNYRWRIIEKNINYVKIVMDELVKSNDNIYLSIYGNKNYYSNSYGVGNYLNTNFYNSLTNKDYIKKSKFFSGKYDYTNKYDYTDIADYSEMMNVGLLQIGERFINDVDNYFLSTRTKTTTNQIYNVLEEGRIYVGGLTEKLGLRPTIYLVNDIKIKKGNGTKNNPYMIGD